MGGPAPTRTAYTEQIDPGDPAKQVRRNEALANLVRRAPLFRSQPGLAHDLVVEADERGGRQALDDLLVDAVDVHSFVALKQEMALFAGADPDHQRAEWDKMPRARQQAYRRQGYVPPQERPEPHAMGIGRLGRIPFVSDALEGAWDWTGGQVVSAAGDALQTLDNIGRVLPTVYRMGRTGALDDTAWNAGAFISAWRRAWNGERYFKPEVASAVQEMFDDEEAYEWAADLAAGKTVAELAKTGGKPGTPGYGRRYAEVQDFAQHPLTIEAVRRLQQAKISVGRDLASALGQDPGTPGYTILSGAADFAVTWFADPTLIAGKARKGYMLRKHGLEFLNGGDIVSRVRSFYRLPEMAAAEAARELVDVTAPGYLTDLAKLPLGEEERAAVFIADHVKAGEYSRLRRAKPDLDPLITTLEKYHRDGHGRIRSGKDVAKFFERQVGITAIADGRYARYLDEYDSLPRLSRVGTQRIRAKVAFDQSIDFLEGAPVRLRSALEEGETVGTLTKAVNQLHLDHVGTAARRLITLIPQQHHLAFDAPNTPQVLSRLLDFGVTGEQRHDFLDTFVRATTDQAKRNVVRDVYRTIFANIGALDDPKYAPIVKRWLDSDLQRYALDGIDIIFEPGSHRQIHAGLRDIDRAHAVAIPEFREIAAMMRRNRLGELLNGATHSTQADRFMRYWRPAVILRPAFALRAGGEEALSQFARFGLGHPLKQWVFLPLAAKGDEVPLWFDTRMSMAADAIFGKASERLGDTIVGGLASAIHGGVKAVVGEAQASDLSIVLRRAARHTVTRSDLRAYRDLANMDIVQRSYLQVGGSHVGIQGAVTDVDEPTFRLDLGSVDEPRIVEFRVIGSEYDDYVDGDELRRPMLANTIGRWQDRGGPGGSKVDSIMLKARQMRMTQPRAERIVAALPARFTTGDSFDEVAQVRRTLGNLYDSQRRRILKWLDNGDTAALDEVLDRLAPGKVRDLVASFKETGRWTRQDLHALMVDVKRTEKELGTLLSAQLPDWREYLAKAERGDVEAAQHLEETAGFRRMFDPDVKQDYRNLDRNVTAATDDEERARFIEHYRDIEQRVLAAEKSQALEPITARQRTLLGRGDWEEFSRARGYTEDEIADFAEWMRLNERFDQADGMIAVPYPAHSPNAGTQAATVDDPGVLFDRGTRRLDERSLDTAFQENAHLLRVSHDQLLQAPDGDELHEFIRPLADGKFSYKGHVDKADGSRLPAKVYGPKLEPVPGVTLTERLTRWGFDHLGDQVAAIARRPLYHRAYADRWRRADVEVGPFLRDKQLALAAHARIGDLDEAGDALWDAWLKLPEELRASGASALNDKLIRETLAGVKATVVDSEDMPNIVRRWWANELVARQEITRIAMTGAVRDVVPFIDDHRIRSQFSENARNLFPFWFAQEQFYKRWGRVFRSSPEALRRLQLAHHGLYAAGWLDVNEQGEEVFVYPGAEFVTNAIARASEVLWPGSEAFTLPIAAQMTGQLQYAAPGLDSFGRGGLPQAGPLVALSLSALRRLNPEIGAPLEERVLGARGARRSVADIVVPASAMRIYRAVTADDTALASAAMGAIQMLELADAEARAAGDEDGLGFVPGPDAGTHEKEVYLDRVRHWSRVLLFTRAFVGFVGPASPQVDLDPTDLSPEYLAMIRSGLSIEEATQRFLTENPDATAFMVFGSSSPTGAPTDPTADAYKVLVDHEKFFEELPETGAWLLPSGVDDGFDQKAWDQMFALNVRVRRGIDDFYEEIKYREAAPTFFEEQRRKDAAKENHKGDGEAQRRIDEAWRTWRDEYLALHPTFADRYRNPTGPERRRKVLEQIREALGRDDRPDVDHAEMLTRLLDNYDRFKADIEATKGDDSENGIATRRALKQAFHDWADAFSVAHPTVEAFFRRILEPELDLPPEVVG